MHPAAIPQQPKKPHVPGVVYTTHDCPTEHVNERPVLRMHAWSQSATMTSSACGAGPMQSVEPGAGECSWG
jgi:hypothetical protein